MNASFSKTDWRHLQAAEGWLALGDWSSANTELEEIQPLQRAHPSVLNLRVQIYAKAKRWHEALLFAFSAAPSADAQTLVALAICACQTHDLENAKRWVDQAIGLNPSSEFKLRILNDQALRPIWVTSA